MNALAKLFRDLGNWHIGQVGRHRWKKWRERTWCEYCGKETR
jgi:hypothetical protein